MKRIFLLCVFVVTHAYAHQEEPVQESPFRAGITVGFGPAFIYGEGTPTFDVSKVSKDKYTGPISGKISNFGLAGGGGVYFSYAFSNYISGEIQVNSIARMIYLYDKEALGSLEGYKPTPFIELKSVGLSFPLLGCLHPFGSQNGLKLLAGMALDFLTLHKEFKKYPMGIGKDDARDVDFTNFKFKDELRNWDMAFVIGIGYEWRSGWGVGIRHHRGLLGFLKKDGLADELFTGSGIAGIKNIKNHHTIFTLNYSIVRP
ncbi:MAG: hypothetical protein NQ127_00220 [Candidatus Cardinium sp.]|nr:hypothetical protein [Candidatus Cardinium sp.]